MEYETFARAVQQDAALRRRQVLQPIGGKGDKIFPPTYPEERRGQGPRHVFERRRIDGREVWCVLVDSVQSQANRLEESLLAALRQGAVSLPHVTVDFRDAGLSGLAEITSLEAPHRVYDAILRDSLLDGTPFMKSPLGLRLAEAKPGDATALLEASPNALLFGAWHSTGEGGGLGAKFPRCLVSEIIAVEVPVEDGPADPRSGEIEVRTAGRRTGSRIDPLGILRRVEVFKGQDGWDTNKDRAGKGAKLVRPSEINHGNMAPSEQDECGYALRSRCDLVCDGRAPLELVHPDGTVDRVEIDGVAARALYAASFEAAVKAGFRLSAEPVRLAPQPKLVEIVQRSQKLALEGEGGEAEPQG